MKTYKMSERKIIEPKQVYDKTLCDICKKGIDDQHYTYKNDEASVEVKTGYTYPEGSDRTMKSIDICADCFTNKLIPLIEKEFSIKFEETDISW